MRVREPENIESTSVATASPARSTRGARAERAAALKGAIGYLAPEIHFDIAADGGATPQSDLYSLACIAFELLTGQPPYEADEDLLLAVLHRHAQGFGNNQSNPGVCLGADVADAERHMNLAIAVEID